MTERRTLPECLGRAWLASRANWQLVPLVAVQNFLVSLLLLLSFVPPLVVVAGPPPALDWTDPDPVALERWIEELGRRAGENLPALGLALVASTVIGLIAAVVWAFVQAGVVGVLAAGDRQAPAAGTGGAWPLFRTFSWREFAGWGNQYLWRFFGFLHLLLLVALVLTAGFVLVLAAVGLLTESAGMGAAAAVGCALLAAFGLVWLLYALWTLAAHPYLVDLVDPAAPAPAGPVAGSGRRERRAGVVAAAGRGWRLLGRRFGALVGIVAVVVMVAVVLVLPLVLVQMAVELAIPAGAVVAVASLVSIVLQTLASAALTVYGLAATVALARGEALRRTA